MVSFLSLPAEIRNKIYDLILLSPEPIQVGPWRWEKPLNDELRYLLPKEPALLRTSQQIRLEASPVFFGGNIFISYRTVHMAEWIRRLSNDQLMKLRNVRPDEGRADSHLVYYDSVIESRHSVPGEIALWFIETYGRGMLAKDAVAVPTIWNGNRLWVPASGSDQLPILVST